VLGEHEHLLPDAEQIFSNLLYRADDLAESVCSVLLLERRDGVGPRHDLGLVTALHGLPGQFEADGATGAHRIDVRLDPAFQICGIRPGNLGVSDASLTLSEQELELGEVLLLELTEELSG
jgi:hypothetical protein